MPNTTARVAPDLLKTLAIISDTTVRRSTVDREDLKLYIYFMRNIRDQL